MTETIDRPQAEPDEPRKRSLSPFAWEVARRIEALQNDLTDQRPSVQSRATGLTAQLRRSVTKAPGSVPAIWELTIDGFPGTVHGDDPTREERAAHAAMTLYAVHQQSRDRDMHVRGTGFGRAVRNLASRDGNDRDNEKPVRRRFNAAVTATSFDEVIYHLRGLITQLNAAKDIPLDYGMLADDLAMFQRSGGADKVRRRWGRQYYQVRPKQNDQNDGNGGNDQQEEAK